MYQVDLSFSVRSLSYSSAATHLLWWVASNHEAVFQAQELSKALVLVDGVVVCEDALAIHFRLYGCQSAVLG